MLWWIMGGFLGGLAAGLWAGEISERSRFISPFGDPFDNADRRLVERWEMHRRKRLLPWVLHRIAKDRATSSIAPNTEEKALVPVQRPQWHYRVEDEVLIREALFGEVRDV